MKKPKLKRYPKAPKSNAKPEVLKRYLDKCKAIKADNEAKLRPYEKFIKDQARLKKEIANLKAK
jgi:hypothetical protein